MHRKTIDVVLWGATGFTGRLIANHFVENLLPKLPSNFSLALAGRDKTRLHDLQEELCNKRGVDIGNLAKLAPIEVVDAHNQSAWQDIAARSRLVLAAAGPFHEIGTGIVEACVSNHCNYVDITGEVPWVKTICDRFHEHAQREQVMVVPMCGFDSVPSDLTTFVAVEELRSKFQEPAHKVRSYVTMQGTSSGGTIKTGILLKKKFLDDYNNPYLLSRGINRDESSVMTGKEDACWLWEQDCDSADLDTWAVQMDTQQSHNTKNECNIDESKIWTAPFVMAKINTRVVRRSEMLFRLGVNDSFGSTQHTDPRYYFSERMVCRSKVQAERVVKNEQIGSSTIENLVQRRRLPSPGQGPNEEQRKAAWFQFTTIAESESGKRVAVKLAGGDGGYEDTAKMVSQAALCALQDRSQLSCSGGVLTPAVAFGSHLRRRLESEDLIIEVLPKLPSTIDDFYPTNRCGT